MLVDSRFHEHSSTSLLLGSQFHILKMNVPMKTTSNYFDILKIICQMHNSEAILQVDIDFESEPIGLGKDGKEVFFRDIWPTSEEVAEVSCYTLKCLVDV